MKTEKQIIIRTKKQTKASAYFRGEIKKGYFPFDGKQMFYIDCLSYSGGGDAADVLSVIEWKYDKKKDLLIELKKFKKSNNLVVETINAEQNNNYNN